MKLKAKTRLPPLSALRTFAVAAESDSFSAAARELFVTPGAVSRQVRLLEDELGVTLYHRSGNSVRLNSAGRKLAARLKQGLSMIANAVEEARQETLVAIRVSSAPSIASKLLANWLCEYADSYPGVEISLDATDRVVNLDQHEADLAVRFVTSSDIPRHSRLLIDEVLFPVCGPEYYAANGPWESPDDLYEKDLLHAAWVSGNRTSVPGWNAWFATCGNSARKVPTGIRLKLLGLAVNEAQKNRGVALGPRSLVAEDVAEGRLVAPFGNAYQLSIPWCYCIAWGQMRPLSATQSKLVDWIVKRAEQTFTAP